MMNETTPMCHVRRHLPIVLGTAFSILLCAAAALPQDAIPVEILRRTLYVKVGNVTGTAFKIDYKGKVFLVTARHVAAGLPEIKAIIQVMKSANGQWENYATIRTLYPPSKDADIAVFETDEKISRPYEVGTAGSMTFGQQVWFLGYPGRRIRHLF